MPNLFEYVRIKRLVHGISNGGTPSLTARDAYRVNTLIAFESLKEQKQEKLLYEKLSKMKKHPHPKRPKNGV